MVDKQPESDPGSPTEPLQVDVKKDKEKKTGSNDRSAASRVDIDISLNKMHELLGDRWSTYQTIVSDFLMGRATRQEFEASLQPLITLHRSFIRHHNEILMTLLTNSFREPAPPIVTSLGWSKKRREHPTQQHTDRGDPAAKRLKTEVLGLTNRERARIKGIPKLDPNQRPRPNSMIETRFAKLPRVPVTPQKINSSQHLNDIVKGLHVPLCTESQHLPEPASLKDRILATCLENGLLGGLEDTIPELLINGLDIHLRNVLTSTISKLRRDRPDCVTLSSPDTAISNHQHPPPTPHLPETWMHTHDLAFTYTLTPHIFVEPAHPIMRMMSVQLDDATAEAEKAWQELRPSDVESQRMKVARVLDELI